MKRILAIKLIVFLLLGAVTTVGVAWGLAYWIGPYSGEVQPAQNPITQSYFTNRDTTPRWIFKRLVRPGAVTCIWLRQLRTLAETPMDTRPIGFYLASWYEQAAPPAWSQIVGSTSVPTDPAGPLVEQARGWPMLALSCVVELKPDLLTGRYRLGRIHQGLALNERGWPPQQPGMDWYTGPTPNRALLPLRPVFFGFAINTIFYAAILWALWSAPFAARRLVRRRRGRCIRCGYDLGHAAHDVCPECGRGFAQCDQVAS